MSSYLPLNEGGSSDRAWWAPRSEMEFEEQEENEENFHVEEEEEEPIIKKDEEETTKTEAMWGSLNYDHFINDASIAANKRWRPRSRRVCFGYSGKTLSRWVVTCGIGVAMGATAIAISRLIELFLGLRVGVMAAVHGEWYAILVYSAWNCMLAAVAASLVVFIAPGAAGSGIPVVKAYLNGVRPATQTSLSLSVFLVKLISTSLAVASNASLGQEGPLVHLGAIIGSLLTGGFANPCSGVENFFGRRGFCGPGWFNNKHHGLRRGDRPPFFRSDVDRRDFLSIGAACGFSAAFGAPIGGVLFALEEASSFFTNELLLRCLVGTALATFASLMLSENVVGFTSLSHYGLISLNSDNTTVMIGVLPVAVVFGLAGGMIGALFNSVWFRLMSKRQKFMKGLEDLGYSHFSRSCVRVLDATACILITSLLFYASALASSSWACVPRDHRSPHVGGNGWTVKFNCKEGQIHELASLWFHGNTREKAITKVLDAENDVFFAGSLFISGCLTLFTLGLSFGHTLPGGMFLPLIFAGVCFGGAVTRTDWLIGFISRGGRQHLALLGAVALLSGVQRSTVSLVVIILEGTGNASLLIPIIITTITARWTGDLFGPGLYELSLELRNTPFLEKHVRSHMDDITVMDLMHSESNLATLPLRPTTKQATALLRSSDHGAFPVVADAPDGRRKLMGLVLREHVRALLTHRHYVNENIPQKRPPLMLQSIVAMAAWDSGRSRGQYAYDCSIDPSRQSTDSHTKHLSDPLILNSPPGSPTGRSRDESKHEVIVDVDAEARIDLEFVMVRSPHVVYDDCPASRAYRLFVTMGLRHLLIVDHSGTPVGMITRKDWLPLLHQLDKQHAHE